MKPSKIENLIIGALLIPLIFYAVFYLSCLLDPRFTFQEMDLNKDGFVTLTEADYVSSSGEREIIVNGAKCIEYFAYKDGLPVKTKCNADKPQ